MGLVYSPDYLSEEVPGAGLPQPPPGPDVGVEVSVTRGKHQVDVLMAHHDLLHSHSQILDTIRYDAVSHLYWVDVGVAVHSVVRGQQALTRSFPTDNL